MPIKKKGRRQLLQIDIIHKITEMNLDEKPTTIENIQKELSEKISVGKIIKQRPTIVKELLSTAIAEGKIYPLKIGTNNDDDDDVIVHRTPRMLRDNDRQSIIMYDGQIPGTSYFNILKNCYTFERDNNRIHEDKNDGFTIEEIQEHFKILKKHFLNYSVQILKEKLIPLALKNGHIERIKSSNDQIKYSITQSFRNTYDLYRRNRKLALLSIGEIDNTDDSQIDDADDSIIEQNDDESSNVTFTESNDSNMNDNKLEMKNESEQQSLVMKISTKNFSNKSPELKSKTMADIQPQRVSQRKKIRKTLGPDFLDSYSDVMMNHPKHLSRKFLTPEQQSALLIAEQNNDGSSTSTFKKKRSSLLCIVCSKAFKSPKQSRIVCSECNGIAHGKCFRSYVNTKIGIIRMICSNCRPESICYMCNNHERNPEMYVQCISCSSTYHAHCYREKAHSLCQKCRAQVMNNISQPSSSSTTTTDSQVENESKNTSDVNNESSNMLPDSDPKSSTSTVKITPKVTIAPIKLRSLIQSAKNTSSLNGNNVSGSGGGKSLISKSSNSLDKPKQMFASKSSTISMTQSSSNDNSTNGFGPSSTTFEKSKKIKDEPMDIVETTVPSVSTLSSSSTSTMQKNLPSISGEAKISSTLTTETNMTNSLAKSSDGISNKLTTTKKRKLNNTSSSFEIWNKKPSQSICYHFQAWLNTELRNNCKRFGPDVDLGPLTTLPNIITEWTSENVHRFLVTLGFKEEADTFLEKDINGLSLMLLTRYDFIHSLSINLGPAIRLLGIVNRLHEEL
ncbi:uncharacterized protein LOC113799735 [Dermatophagoides pteronyssinus]|uniref:uncharacterized protein LOC113799735 n=1 Tax=Dermatophagoides pteronyssinus TaxID=6956 RepID=UPI003F677B61